MPRISGAQAGYMELVGAIKDADCYKVEVPGGVASNRGCCNEFEPKAKTTDKFSCGNCEHRDADNDAPMREALKRRT
jgi:hypothetical protein